MYVRVFPRFTARRSRMNEFKNIDIYNAQARHLNCIGVLMIYMSDRYKKMIAGSTEPITER
jgi:hypothetical protein